MDRGSTARVIAEREGMGGCKNRQVAGGGLDRLDVPGWQPNLRFTQQTAGQL